MNGEIAHPFKATPPARDRLRSRILVWIVAPLLCVATSLVVAGALLDLPHVSQPQVRAISISLPFALVTWLLKAATPAAAACGGMICLLLTYSPAEPGLPPRSGLV